MGNGRGIHLFAAMLVASAAGLLVPGYAFAGTLDQQQPGGTALVGNVRSSQSFGQTFKAGISGGLDRVDLALSKDPGVTAPLLVEVRDVDSGGNPGSTVLAGYYLPPSSVPTTFPALPAFVSMNLPSPASVVAGTEYAIVVWSPGSYYWGAASGDPYLAGESFFVNVSPPAGPWNSQPTDDQAFKTYVTPPTPPPTGQRAAALKKCKHKHSKKKRAKCRKRAKLLPV